MLNFQNAPINFTKGLETKDDEILADGNDVMENVDMSEKATPEKRYGFKKYPALISYPASTSPDVPVSELNEAIAYENRAAVSADGQGLFFSRALESYSPQTYGTDYQDDVSYPLLAASQAESVKLPVKQESLEVSYAENSVYKVQGSGGLLEVVRKADGSKVFGGNIFSSLKSPSFTILNDEIYATSFRESGADTDWQLLKFDGNGEPQLVTNIIASTAANFGNIATQYNSIDTDGTNLFVAYWLDSGGTYKVFKLQPDGTELASYTHTTTTDAAELNTPIDLSVNGGKVCVTIIRHVSATPLTEIQVLELTDTLALVGVHAQTPGSVSKGANLYTQLDNGNLYLGSTDIQLGGLFPPLSDFYLLNLDSGAFSTDPTTSSNVIFYSKPAVKNGKAYFVIRFNTDSLSVYHYGLYVIGPKASSGRLCAYLKNDASFETNSGFSSSSGPFIIPQKFKFDSTFLVKAKNDVLDSYTLSFDRSYTGSFVENKNLTYIPGALPSVFDGFSVFPVGFYSFPFLFNSSLSSGSIPAGTYNYVAIYVYTDRSKNIYRSRVPLAKNVTLASSSKVQLNIGTVGPKGNLIEAIEVYRKKDTETVYRLVFSLPANTTGFTDDEASLVGKKTLYTTGGIVESAQPLALVDLASHENRLFGVSLDAKVYFSKTSVRGEAFQFSEFFTINIDENQGRRAQRLTAVAGLDNKLVVFKKNSMFAIFGSGPDNTGANNDFSSPELITTDVGCETPRSIVLNSAGAYFKGEKGIYQISRGLQLDFVGADVTRFNGLTITAAVLLEASNRVVFTTREGTSLVHNYNLGTWTTYTNMPAVSAFMSNGKFLYFRSDATAWEEQAEFSDDGAFIPQKITTNWMKIAGIQGFQRVQRLMFIGKYRGDHTMKVKVYYDYEDYAWDEYTLNPIDADYNQGTRPTDADYQNGVNNGVFQWSIHLKKQKCQAIKIEIFDEQRGGVPTEAFSLSNMTIKVGLKKGLGKISEKKSI